MIDRSLDQKIEYVAQLMAETVENPEEFIQEWYKEKHPQIHENVWGGVKNAASQMWQGFKSGGQAFARDAWGPKAKFDSAIKTLTGLSQYLKKDPQLANWTSSNGNLLVNDLDAMIERLNGLQRYIPQNQIQGGRNNWTDPSINPATGQQHHTAPNNTQQAPIPPGNFRWANQTQGQP